MARNNASKDVSSIASAEDIVSRMHSGTFQYSFYRGCIFWPAHIYTSTVAKASSGGVVVGTPRYLAGRGFVTSTL